VEGNIIYSTHLGRDEPPYNADNPILRGREPIREEAYLTDALTREALSFIERHRREPFFLYLSYNAVHSPKQGARSYMERFRRIEDMHRRVFAAMLGNLDDSIGAVLKKLRACGLEERTLIFFLSDNGGPTRELTSSNAPLRGGKGSLYEGGIRIPFILQWKGTIPAGKVYSRPVISTDVFATACAAAGAPLPEGRRMDGVNLLDYLSGKNVGDPHDVLFWRMGRKGALRRGDWKLVRQEARGAGKPRIQLFNLARDIGEEEDLGRKVPAKLRELRELWENMSSEMVDPVWSPGKGY
jgi:arylsulfatase B